ncbi:hypothetical protein GOP47_0026642 [Adiantum capillus-veneris]|nr:hypothetical protein GOP47_0026642 [Adiantum capillus-veneris]
MMLIDCCNHCETQIPDGQQHNAEGQGRDIVDIITDSGGERVDEASLFLLDSPIQTSDHNSPVSHYSTVERTSWATSSESLLSSRHPIFPSKCIFSDGLDDTIVNATTTNISISKGPNIVPSCSQGSSQVLPPLPHLPQMCSPNVTQNFCSKQAESCHTNPQTMLLNEATYGRDLQAYFLQHFSPYNVLPLPQGLCHKSSSNLAATTQPSTLNEPKHEHRLQALALPFNMAANNQLQEGVVYGQHPCNLAADDCTLKGIASQRECNWKSSGGLDIMGFTDYNNKQIYSNGTLPGLQVLGNHCPMRPDCCRGIQDVCRYAPHLLGSARSDNAVLFPPVPPPPPSIYRGPRFDDFASLYTSDKIKDLSLAGVEMLSDDGQPSTVKINFQPYRKEEKDSSIDRYRRKRSERNFSKKIKYICRKTLADSRPRIKGRFARTDDT